jgi:hypothetical protein
VARPGGAWLFHRQFPDWLATSLEASPEKWVGPFSLGQGDLLAAAPRGPGFIVLRGPPDSSTPLEVAIYDGAAKPVASASLEGLDNAASWNVLFDETTRQALVAMQMWNPATDAFQTHIARFSCQ